MSPTRQSTPSFGPYNYNTKKTTTTTITTTTNTNPNHHYHRQKPPQLSMQSLQRTISDISLELSKEANDLKQQQQQQQQQLLDVLPPISEVEDAKCECCGMCEECTPEYIGRVRAKYSGKLICGLCSEAVNEEMKKNGGNRDEAVGEHMHACSRFNRFGRTHPVLFQAQAMKEILKKSCSARAKSLSPRDRVVVPKNNGGIARSSSCIPAINMKGVYDSN